MAYTLKDAKTLCTKAEFELVVMGHKADLAALGAPRLRQKITRVRKLRDKFRDESARQTREARGKSDPRGAKPAQGNDRTVMKAEIFADLLGRFESAFEAARTKTPAKSAKAKAAGKPSKAAAPKPAKKSAKPVAKKTAKKTAAAAAKAKASPASMPTAKAIIKKAGTKTGKKVSKKATTKKAASKPVRSVSGPAATSDAAMASGVTGTSTPRSAIRAGFRSAGAGRAKGHAVSRSRAAQARRDSR